MRREETSDNILSSTRRKSWRVLLFNIIISYCAVIPRRCDKTDRKSIEIILLRCIYDTHTSIDLLYYNLVFNIVCDNNIYK